MNKAAFVIHLIFNKSDLAVICFWFLLPESTLRKPTPGVPMVAQRKGILLVAHEDAGLIPGLAQ